jgi:16S rRNA (uracil1498-N3)-methyltransferase
VRRIFGTIDEQTGSVSLSPEEERHLKVIRVRPGENLEVLYRGQAYNCTVSSLFPLQITRTQKEAVENRELPFISVLFCPLLKRDNFELVLQKATELGVKAIQPYLSSRVIKRVSPAEFEERRERFEKIILEAVEQSNRSLQPELRPLKEYREILAEPASFKFFAYEEEATKGRQIPPLTGLKPQDEVITLVGPEGGFSPEEAAEAIRAGFLPVSLGKRILRAETAVLSALAIVSYLGEQHV